MYDYRVMIELSPEQIRRYIRMYHRRKDWPVMAVLSGCAAVFLVLIWFFRIILTLRLKLILTAVVLAILLCLLLMFRTIRLLYLKKRKPFAIGPHLSMEIRDGYFNVNCGGEMKGYPPRYLKGKITKKGDFILINKKDMIVIPKSALTPNMAEKVKEYFI